MKNKLLLVLVILITFTFGLFFFFKERLHIKRQQVVGPHQCIWDTFYTNEEKNSKWTQFGDVESARNESESNIKFDDDILDIENRFFDISFRTQASGEKILNTSDWEQLLKKVRLKNGNQINTICQMFGNQKYGISESENQVVIFSFETISDRFDGYIISKKSNKWIMFYGRRKITSMSWCDISHKILETARLCHL